MLAKLETWASTIIDNKGPTVEEDQQLCLRHTKDAVEPESYLKECLWADSADEIGQFVLVAEDSRKPREVPLHLHYKCSESLCTCSQKWPDPRKLQPHKGNRTVNWWRPAVLFCDLLWTMVGWEDDITFGQGASLRGNEQQEFPKAWKKGLRLDVQGQGSTSLW